MRRSTRLVVLSMLIALMMVVGASAAIAGEVSGPPGEGGAEGSATPIADYRAKSICSFSGLNDVKTYEPGPDGPPEPTQTQSYGTFLVLIKSTMGLSAQEAKQFLPSPGFACNGRWGFLAG